MRVDLIERIARAAHDARAGRRPFAPDPALATSIGITPDTFARLMVRLGFRSVKGEAPAWVWQGRPRMVSPRKATAPQRDNAFAVLAGLGSRSG